MLNYLNIRSADPQISVNYPSLCQKLTPANITTNIAAHIKIILKIWLIGSRRAASALITKVKAPINQRV